MVFIDEKGRFFGKINILDLTCIGILLLILLAIITFAHGEKNKENEFLKLKVLLKISHQHHCLINSINKGDVENWEEKRRAIVNKIYLTETSEYNSAEISNELNEKYKDIMIELDLLVTEEMGIYQYLFGQEVKIGKNILIRLNSTHINGVVMELTRD